MQQLLKVNRLLIERLKKIVMTHTGELADN